jgi:hypothetical protein
MMILVIGLILIFIIINIKNLIEVGFPGYTSIEGLSIIENINHSQVLHPYGYMLVILILSKGLYYLANSYYVSHYLATETTYGKVISIQYSNNRVNNKPLVNIEVEYLNLTGIFKDQPGDFGFEFNKGDLIPIKYQKDKPEVATIPSNAIEILKDQES